MSPRDNERLEYLGDAVLQLITAEYLYKYRPAANEGELTQTRSAMVNTNTLASLSEELGVGEHLYLGKGIAKGGGRSLKSLLANAFEAILGAIFLDAGYDAAYHFYLDRFRQLPEPVKDENHKGRLQQVVQERFNQTPYYDSAGARGSGHRREYTAVVFAGAEALGTGHGPTKQEAEQDAARNALAKLLGERATRREPRAAEPRPRRRRGRAEAEAPASSEAVTPSEVAEVLESETPALEETAEAVVAEQEALAGVQPPPPPDEPLAEPVAAPEVGGPEPEAKPRRRRAPARRKPAKPAEPMAAEPEPEPEPAPAPVAAAPEPAPEPEPEARPKRRRAPARRRPAATPEAAPEPAPEGAEAPRSRQFGEPLSD